MADNLQTIFSSEFFMNENVSFTIKSSLELFARGPINNASALPGRRQAVIWMNDG